MTDVLAPSPSATSAAVVGLGYRLFDADTHYYEAVDCVTRHLDPALATRVFQWSTIDGRS